MTGFLTKLKIIMQNNHNKKLIQRGKTALKARLAKLPHFSRQTLPYEIALAVDYLAFRKRYGRILSKGKEFADPNKKLFILSFSDYIAQVKAEAFFAKVLELQGFSPVFVTYSTARRALRYYHVFGFDQFIFFDKLLDNRMSSQAIEEVETFFARPLTIQDIKHYRFHGTKLGAHMLRAFTRATYKGSIDLSNPETIQALKTFMQQGMHNVEQAEILLNQVKPEVIFSLHPINIGEGDIFEVGLQLGIDSICWDSAQKDDYWLFKRYKKDARKMQVFSLSDGTWDLARQMVWDDEHETKLRKEIEGRYQVDSGLDRRRLQEDKQLKTKEEVQRQLELDPSKKTAVVFSHIVWDTSFLYGEDLFNTYEEWLVETTRAACKNSAVNWVIKLHPANHRKLLSNRVVNEEPSEIIAIRHAIGTLPSHVKLLYSDTDINTFSLFALTDYCLTVRGTIGIEMSCFGIPVFTAGTGRYSGRGFTIDSVCSEDYLDKLSHIQDISSLDSEKIMLAKKHAYWLFILRPVKFSMIRNWVRGALMKYATHPLATNTLLEIDSLDDLILNSDLNDFTQWVLNGNPLDFYKNSE